MADNDDKTEQPTSKKLSDARNKGQVPRSKEASTFFVLIAGVLSLWVFSSWLAIGMKEIMFKDKHDIEYYRERKVYLDLIEAYDKTTAMIEKCNESNKHNFNIGTSKEELKILDILQKEFNDVVHQYKSKKYNHKCDFYIPSLDLYIEYQGFYTHGTHPYNILNENDKQILDKLKYKADNSINESNCYNKIITNWTINDVRKREEAKENKLNYLEIFNKIAFEAIPDIVKHEFSNNIKNKQLVIGI